MMVLDDEQKIALANLQEDDLINLHFSLGMAVRNAFGLHNADSKLLASCNTAIHPDDVSDVIIKALWEQLKSAGNRLWMMIGLTNKTLFAIVAERLKRKLKRLLRMTSPTWTVYQEELASVQDVALVRI
jgi:hypothetical protein